MNDYMKEMMDGGAVLRLDYSVKKHHRRWALKWEKLEEGYTTIGFYTDEETKKITYHFRLVPELKISALEITALLKGG